MLAYMRICVHICIYASIYAYMQAYMHICEHIIISASIYAYKHISKLGPWCGRSGRAKAGMFVSEFVRGPAGGAGAPSPLSPFPVCS